MIKVNSKIYELSAQTTLEGGCKSVRELHRRCGCDRWRREAL